MPEDHCHLNGLSVVNGKPKYVTALGETDTVGGSRENGATGGVLIDVESSDVVLRGLSMHHSPRWHQGRLWLLNFGASELLCFDPVQSSPQVGCDLPADLRGLCLSGRYAVVGMCQIREKYIFCGAPVRQRYERLLSGLAVMDLPAGKLVGAINSWPAARKSTTFSSCHGQETSTC